MGRGEERAARPKGKTVGEGGCWDGGEELFQSHLWVDAGFSSEPRKVALLEM